MDKCISLREIDPCTMPKRVGPCKGFFPRFYYSPEDNECKLFIFGGCHPNANNFYSKESCDATCLNQIPVENLRTTVPPHIATISISQALNIKDGYSQSISSSTAICMLPKASGSCLYSIRSYFYDPETKFCKVFLYSGCFGNANRFDGRKECEKVCKNHVESAPGSRTIESSQSPAEKDVCKLDVVPEDCLEKQLRFYYDTTAETCLPFVYAGCKENKKGLVTETERMSACGKSPTLQQLADRMVLSCTFGKKTVPIGATVGARVETEYLLEDPPCGVVVCQCITPPAVTCLNRLCPEPTTTEESVEQDTVNSVKE